MARRITRPVLFLCDIQDRFRPAIHAFPAVIQTARKMVRAARIFDIPVVVTTQECAKLGPTCADIGLEAVRLQPVVNADKTTFSMWIPAVQEAIAEMGPGPVDAVIVGIEAHICLTQTVLDLLAAGHRVSVLADGVSSSNKEEVAIALDRLRAEGATVTSSEAWLYHMLADSADSRFPALIRLVKEEKEATSKVWKALL